MTANVMRDFPTAGGMTDVDGVLQIQMRSKGGEVVSVVIHVMTVAGLAGPAVTAPVMGDYAVAAIEEKHHLRVPVVRGERPAVRKNDWLTGSPVLVIDLDAVFGGDRAHGVLQQEVKNCSCGQ